MNEFKLTREELKSKDWQLLTAELLIENTAMLKTILWQNNNLMMASGHKSFDEVCADTNKQMGEFREIAHASLKNFPTYNPNEKEN